MARIVGRVAVTGHRKSVAFRSSAFGRVRRASCLAVVAAVALCAGARADASSGRLRLPGIKGEDNRTLERTVAYPWSAIGRVNRETGGFCTGTLVAPRIVLTAAHCLWNARTRRWLPARALHFVAGYHLGHYLAHARAAAIHVDPRFRTSGKRGIENVAHDCAVLVLAEPIDRVGTIPIHVPHGAETRAPSGALHVIQAGYSQDKPHILTVDGSCALTGTLARRMLLRHDCDATKGDSGSPILVSTGKGYAVIGMHVATLRRTGTTWGIAVPAATLAALVGTAGR